MGLQQDFQTREKIFSARLNGLKKPTLRPHECPRRGTAGGRSPGGEGSEQHSSSAPGRAGQEQPRLLVCSLWLRHVKGWRDKAPTRPRHGPGRAASRAWPRSALGASAGTAARKGARRGGYGGWLLFFSSVPHRPGSAPQTAHGTAQREQPPSLGRNFTAASMGTLGGAAPTGAGGLQAPGPIMGPLI